MSRIVVADLNTVNQVTELSEAELSATKGGFFLLSWLFGGFRGGYGGGYGYGGGRGGRGGHH